MTAEHIQFVNAAVYEALLIKGLRVLLYCERLEAEITAHQRTEDEQRRGLIEKDAQIADLQARLRVFELAQEGD